jgi:hypothetical protein
MGAEVYANGNSIACKAGGGKVIAAFPDVCLSPPSPPAGPIPVPYPDTSFSKDMQDGSKTVLIGGKEVMLKDQSFYKSSPLGDEAATNGLGAGVVTHVITGKTYFSAWSMDVQFEGQNVDRHVDLTTSNHASYPGNSGPMTNMEQMALDRLKDDKCPCCGKPIPDCPGALSQTFSNGKDREPMSHREYYRLDEKKSDGTLTDRAQERQTEIANHPCAGGDCPNAGKAERKSDPPCDVYRVLTKAEADEAEKGRHFHKDEHRDHHGVPRAKGAIRAFFTKDPTGTIMGITKPQWDAMDVNTQNKVVQIDHVTPRAAGGCPNSKSNTQPHGKKCANCKRLDELQDSWHSVEQTERRAALGI